MRRVTDAARTAIAMLALVLAAAGASAAPIMWGQPLDTAAPADIITAGTTVEAINAINSNSGLVTVNSVLFANSNALLPNSTGANFLAGSSTGDANLDALLNKLDYGGGTSTSISIGGGNLIPGNRYQVQVFFTDLRGCCNGRTMTYGDGEATESVIDLHASHGGFGQYGVGTFTADAASQTLTLKTNGFGNAHITAYQLRDVTAPPALAANLQAHWKLDETGGGTAADSADGHHGTITNAIPNQPGIVGSNLAYEFRGAGSTNTGGNDRVVINDGFFLDDYNRLAISAWIKPDTIGNSVGHGGANAGTTPPNNAADGNAIIEGRAQRDALAFQIGEMDTDGNPNTGELYGFLRFGDNSGTTLDFSTDTSPITAGEWQHVAMTYAANDAGDGGTVALYVNGMQVGQSSHSSANKTIDTNDTVNNLLLGAFATNTAGSSGIRNRFDGLIDDLGIWGGTDSPTIPGPVEIAAIHGLGKFAGLALDDPALDALLAAFYAGEGSSTTVGLVRWDYATGLPGALGATGGSIETLDAYIVLGGQGAGMVATAIIPEPATLALLGLAALGLARRRRRG